VRVENKALNGTLELAAGGIEFLKQELVETSIVSIPANALAVAKSLGVSKATRSSDSSESTKSIPPPLVSTVCFRTTTCASRPMIKSEGDNGRRRRKERARASMK
jgi:hypothetical protein